MDGKEKPEEKPHPRYPAPPGDRDGFEQKDQPPPMPMQIS